MNLTNFEKTPIFRVFDAVKREAARYGVAVLESEIVGLVPAARRWCHGGRRTTCSSTGFAAPARCSRTRLRARQPTPARLARRRARDGAMPKPRIFL